MKVPSFKLIFSLVKREPILDIGCGGGYLSNLFKDYVGIDVNKKAVVTAKKNTNAEYILADATCLPFRSCSLNTCIAYDFIEHINNIEQVIAEMKRVSTKVVISCVDFSSYYKFFTYDESHQKLLMPNELAAITRQYFSRVRLFKTSGLFMIPGRLNIFLSKYLPNQIVLEALS
jgi:ubiquinone/menaquinone biosynthesis C-methylase UbiE